MITYEVTKKGKYETQNTYNWVIIRNISSLTDRVIIICVRSVRIIIHTKTSELFSPKKKLISL